MSKKTKIGTIVCAALLVLLVSAFTFMGVWSPEERPAIIIVALISTAALIFGM